MDSASIRGDETSVFANQRRSFLHRIRHAAANCK